MIIGVPKEIKNNEYRVGLTPFNVKDFIHFNHEVLIQKDAGESIGFTNADYEKAGAKIVATAADVFKNSDMIIKVKEPQESEWKMLKKDQILYAYLHLAPDPKQTQGLIQSGATAIAFETITDNFGQLPLLTPMSEVAGRMSIQAGMHSLEKTAGGRGVLLSGVPGVKPGKVVIIGGGVVGENAAKVALGVGAEVCIFEKNLSRIRQLDALYGPNLKCLYSSKQTLEDELKNADLVIGAVLIPGAKAPKVITKKMLKLMKKGSVIVDVAIDQGGCFETSKATTHQDPIFIVDDIVHYCVANMPGAVAYTSTLALTNAIMHYALELANKGLTRALSDNPHLKNGVNVAQGNITYKAVADALGYDYIAVDSLLSK